jgi:hypothetical protein
MAIAIDGDEAKGKTDIALDQQHLSKVDRLAICLAGLEAQEVFQTPTHERAGYSDLGKAIEIIGEDASEEQSRALRKAGYDRARELMLLHDTKLIRLAIRLTEQGSIEPHEFVELMNGAVPTAG